jgi:hypothetical protein
VGHRAKIYTVRVRRKRDKKSFLPLGNFDDQGTSLIAVLADYLGDFEASDQEETRKVRSSRVTLDGDELFVSVLHGQTGMVADIVDKKGILRLRQTVDDTQLVRCGCLMVLRPAADMGFLATHVNNGRAIKGLLEDGIRARFGEQFPGHVLAIKPLIEGSVLQQAIEDGRIRKLRLRRVDRSDDPVDRSLGKWLQGGTEATVELTLSPRAKGAYLRSQLALRSLGGDRQAFAQLLEYDGQTYDEAKVEVTLANGQKRTFTLGEPDSGQAVAEELASLSTEDGEPTEQSIRDALRAVLSRAMNAPG